jgi:hypothetical protein
MPVVPEKKSFPPRILIILLGTSLSLCGAAVCAFGQRAWDATDSSDPRKAMAEDVITEIRARISHFSRNGAKHDQEEQGLWRRFISRRNSKNGNE